MEEINKYLTYEQMQQSLPDYVFGRLNEAERSKFEGTLHLYPDLISEIEDVKKVFSKIEELDFNNILEKKTRNLSVKVQDRLRSSKRGERVPGYFFKIIVPTIGMAAIVLYLFVTGLHNLNDKSIHTTASISKGSNSENDISSQFLNSRDVILLFEGVDSSSKTFLNVMNKYTYSHRNSTSSDEYVPDNVINIDDYYHQAFYDLIYSMKSKPNNNILNEVLIGNWDIGNEIEDLDENDINKLLEDIKNEDIFS